jgi:hypothetical protein
VTIFDGRSPRRRGAAAAAAPLAAAAADAPEAAGAAQPKKVSFVSLGCPKNVVDGEVMLGDLERSGLFEVTADHEAADAIVINTCAFVEVRQAEQGVSGVHARADAHACACRRVCVARTTPSDVVCDVAAVCRTPSLSRSRCAGLVGPRWLVSACAAPVPCAAVSWVLCCAPSCFFSGLTHCRVVPCLRAVRQLWRRRA